MIWRLPWRSPSRPIWLNGSGRSSATPGFRHERAAEFWEGALALVNEFDRPPRSGSTAYGFVVGIYPIPDYPVLPEPEQ